MTEQRRTRKWMILGALALLPFVLGKARAQDVFANTSTPTPSYESQASSSCEEANHQHLAIDSPDPARCFNPVPAVNGYCSPIGGAESTLALQQGNLCYYCQQAPMPGKEIVIPSTGGASLGIDSYQWMCTSNPSAPACYLSCFGNFPSPTFPPGSSVDKETEPNGDPVFKIKIANEPEPQASTPDPCFPAGPKNYNVCDYPNLTRPPGCECTKTPPPTIMAQLAPSSPVKPTCSPVSTGTQLWFSDAEVATLNADLNQARATVAKAKTYTNQATWDKGTLAIANKYFGTTSTQMQQLMRQSVNNVLNVLNGMTSAANVLFPTGSDPDAIKNPPPANCLAYVRPKSGEPTQIFLCGSFWNQPKTGPDSQVMVIIHEVSHLPNGASTRDFAYDQEGCERLVFFGTPAGQIIQSFAPATVVPGISGLTENPPGPYTPSSPMENADSFKYFVYDVANRIIPTTQK